LAKIDASLLAVYSLTIFTIHIASILELQLIALNINCPRSCHIDGQI